MRSEKEIRDELNLVEKAINQYKTSANKNKLSHADKINLGKRKAHLLRELTYFYMENSVEIPF